MPHAVGEKFGRFVLEQHLGSGGFADVYRAFDTKLERQGAIKIPRADAAAVNTARVLREVRAAADIAHSNIVTIFDVAEIEGLPVVVMELLVGQTLRAWIGPNGAPRDRAIRWLVQLADALIAIHGRGLVHRDVKPDNI